MIVVSNRLSRGDRQGRVIKSLSQAVEGCITH